MVIKLVENNSRTERLQLPAGESSLLTHPTIGRTFGAFFFDCKYNDDGVDVIYRPGLLIRPSLEDVLLTESTVRRFFAGAKSYIELGEGESDEITQDDMVELDFVMPTQVSKIVIRHTVLGPDGTEQVPEAYAGHWQVRDH
jgi:hypothetical protein